VLGLLTSEATNVYQLNELIKHKRYHKISKDSNLIRIEPEELISVSTVMENIQLDNKKRLREFLQKYDDTRLDVVTIAECKLMIYYTFSKIHL
jgi:hypothetical protein